MTKAKPRDEAEAEVEHVPAEADEASTEPETEPVASYEAQVIDPEPEQSEPAQQETQPEVPKGHAAIRYVGPADLFEHGAYQFRGGQPVIVPSAVAEELLTYPFERFERA